VDARGTSGGGGSMNFLMLGGLLFALGLRHSRKLGRSLGAGLGMMCALPGLAHADESAHWYVGADFGTAKSDLGEGDVNARLADLGYDVVARIDNSRTAWSVYGGYSWSRYFAVQAGYTDLGDVESRFSGNASDIANFMRDANVVQPQSADGFDITLVGRYPLHERFAVSAQLGGFYWDTESELRDTSDARVRREDEGFDLAYGVGAELSLTQRAVLSVGWKRRDLGDEAIDLISLGARYQW
jgi:OOP family OmpA-OmpF porin